MFLANRLEHTQWEHTEWTMQGSLAEQHGNFHVDASIPINS